MHRSREEYERDLMSFKTSLDNMMNKLERMEQYNRVLNTSHNTIMYVPELPVTTILSPRNTSRPKTANISKK